MRAISKSRFGVAIRSRLFADRIIRKALPVTFLLIAITVLWISTYDRWSRSSWKYPPLYRGDALYELGIIRAASLGYYRPLAWKLVPTLGAPNGANWNDYPQTEDFHYAFFGALAAIFGLMPAANLSLLIAFLVNGVAFYWACRLLRQPIVWSLVGSVLFTFSHFAYARGFGHLELSYYGHLALALVAVWRLRAGSIRRFADSRALFVFAIAAWCGVQNAYYTYVIAQLLGLTILVNCVRARDDPGQWRAALIGMVSLAILFAGFFIGNLDTLTYRWHYGPNAAAVVRQYADTEYYALKPIELFLPNNMPPWPIVGRLIDYYAHAAYFRGEPWATYLGIVPCLSLIALVILAFVCVARGRRLGRGLTRGVYDMTWICCLSVVGGINSMLAIGGLVMFRATNRYSIVILTVALLFFVRLAVFCTRKFPNSVRIAIAATILALGLVDQIFPKDVTGLRSKVDSDRIFCATLEHSLPPGSGLFQLPVAAYPEQVVIAHMGDYEHLRPFLYTTSLRFSYGDDKGRARADWQRDIEALPVVQAIGALRTRGFTAVILNRDGYADRGDALVNRFKEAGATVITEAANADLIALKLP